MPQLGMESREYDFRARIWFGCTLWSWVLCFSLPILVLSLRKKLCGYNQPTMSQVLLAEIMMLENRVKVEVSGDGENMGILPKGIHFYQEIGTNLQEVRMKLIRKGLITKSQTFG